MAEGRVSRRDRNGLVVDTSLTKATGTAEREAAIAMIGDLSDDGASPWAPTKATTRRTSSPRCAASV